MQSIDSSGLVEHATMERVTYIQEAPQGEPHIFIQMQEPNGRKKETGNDKMPIQQRKDTKIKVISKRKLGGAI